jgi:hypothetical protein
MEEHDAKPKMIRDRDLDRMLWPAALAGRRSLSGSCSKSLALFKSIALAGMESTAMLASTAKTGTRRKTARCLLDAKRRFRLANSPCKVVV